MNVTFAYEEFSIQVMSVMINKNLKAGNVLPPLQVLIHCLDEPSQIGGKENSYLSYKKN